MSNKKKIRLRTRTPALRDSDNAPLGAVVAAHAAGAVVAPTPKGATPAVAASAPLIGATAVAPAPLGSAPVLRVFTPVVRIEVVVPWEEGMGLAGPTDENTCLRRAFAHAPRAPFEDKTKGTNKALHARVAASIRHQISHLGISKKAHGRVTREASHRHVHQNTHARRIKTKQVGPPGDGRAPGFL